MTDLRRPFDCFVIGGSAGAIETLGQILPSLPNDPEKRTYSVICVLHLLPRGQSLLPLIFKDRCPWPLKDAESTEVIEKGFVYFAPSDYHLSVENDRTFSLSTEEPFNYSRPSIDVFLHSAARVFKNELVALIISGANNDGAAGCLEILRRGGRCLAQSPETAQFPEMPKSALQVSQNVSPVDSSAVVQFLNGRC